MMDHSLIEKNLTETVIEILGTKAPLFEQLVKFLGYQSSGELLRIEYDEAHGYIQNPEQFYQSTLNKRIHQFNFGSKSFFEKLDFDLRKRNLFVTNFYTLFNELNYSLMNREFLNDSSDLNSLVIRIEGLKNLEERLKLSNNTVQHYISHLEKIEKERIRTQVESPYKFAVFVHIDKRTSNIQKLSLFLYEKGFIKERKAFEDLFISQNEDFDAEKVVWLTELVDLCFLLRFLIVHSIIKDDSKWAQNVSNNFISESKRKKKPKINPDSLSTTSSKHGLGAYGPRNQSEWVKTKNKPEITLMYQELRKLYD